MGEYRYPENKSETKNEPEAPLKKDDHTPEALGRFMIGHFDQSQIVHHARQRVARVAR
jgi:hypothetical protein